MNVILETILTELKRQKKNQKELTEYLGISANAFTNWKLDLNRSYEKYLPQISDFLGCSIDYLIGKTDIKTQNLEKKAICEYTGLDERAVDEIKRTTAEFGKSGIPSRYISGFLYNIVQYLVFIEKESNKYARLSIGDTKYTQEEREKKLKKELLNVEHLCWRFEKYSKMICDAFSDIPLVTDIDLADLGISYPFINEDTDD